MIMELRLTHFLLSVAGVQRKKALNNFAGNFGRWRFAQSVGVISANLRNLQGRVHDTNPTNSNKKITDA